MPRVTDVLHAIHEWAPAPSAQSYDNVGLQVGDAMQDVSRVMVALDLTSAVVDEAIEHSADLIVTHHPIIFRPIRSVSASDSYGGLVYRLARAGVSHVAVHTNLDAAFDGVSFALARQLGLSDIGFMAGMPDVLQKLFVFVPVDHLDGVRSAIAEAGGGVIGLYDSCAFASEGTGYFRPMEGATPFIGKADGNMQEASEIRLEVEVARWQMPAVVAAMKAAHPYEEVAHDIVDLRTPSTRHGLGAVGQLSEPMALREFLSHVSRALGAEGLRYAANPSKPVRRVAVCGGSGSSFIREALATGADAYVTADVTYHRFFEVMDGEGRPRMALIDAGHYETEAVTETILIDHLRQCLPSVDYRRPSRPTNPISLWTADSSHEIKR